MKNLMVFVLLAFSFTTFSRSNSIDDFYKKYQQREKVTNMSMEGWVLKLAADFVDEETENRIVQKIKRVRVMVMEDAEIVKAEDLYINAIRYNQKNCKYALVLKEQPNQIITAIQHQWLTHLPLEFAAQKLVLFQGLQVGFHKSRHRPS